MTRIDFYILDDAAPEARDLFACRLAEKAYQQGRQVYIHVPDARRAEHLDTLLWSFRAGSFLPHAIVGQEPPDEDTPVHIGFGADPAGHDDVLINLDSEVPMFFSRFERVAEPVGGQEEEKAAGRERYRFYRSRGYEMETHQIGKEG